MGGDSVILNNVKRCLFFVIFCSCHLFYPPCLEAHNEDNRAIEFPDVPGYLTLVCDLHMHTIFSDGSVGPNIRVTEAKKDHVDVIAMTEHLEYQSWKDDIPNPDRNRSFQIATQYAKNTEVMVINGSEITRSMPPGHANAIFVKDANKLLIDDPMKVFKEARRQDAFIFWNHPHWISQSPDAEIPLDTMHINLMKQGLLEGIEVVNDTTYSDEGLQLALDYNLTILGTSDIHGIVDWQYKIPFGGHRPVTLVFAAEKTPSSLKRALRKGRTVVWYQENLIGKHENLVPLINACLSSKDAVYIKNSTVVNVKLTNIADAPYTLRNISRYNFYTDVDVFTIDPHGEKILDIKIGEKKRKFTMQFEVLNALTAPATHPVITILIKPKF